MQNLMVEKGMPGAPILPADKPLLDKMTPPQRNPSPIKEAESLEHKVEELKMQFAPPKPLGEADLKQWDEIKKAERESKGAPADASALEGVSAALPALMRAEKMQKRAARVGFDWEELHAVVEKIREEVAEVEAEIRAGDREKLEEELGDLLFTVVNLTRKAKFEAEILLNQATNKFVRRFHALEARATKLGKRLPEMTLAEMDALWEQGKE